ncbi:helix-turn-helix domain-containing protein [Hymenobacter persicinus]|uniref:XRE family transcriptional regulator n=1 Tax=Hymenobacter persicinus TaxID=2025506 RepID=A0A4Q5LCE4_9BACT|nr:helix-turn-helix transcriptional regulator [Hymenobacter persicinus]RYU80506.1 XRE family transcriptional regulator [Hymenobacter persicinus]
MFSAARILEIRKSKGYSQELLAEQSGVSLRTIQRVEQGGTVPRGHTVQALAAALGVGLDDFRPVLPPGASELSVLALVPTDACATPATPPVLPADPDFLQLLNLSALSLLVLPLLNILVPAWLWRRRRHTIRHAAAVGRQVLGFQVLWQVGCFGAYLLVLLLQQVAAHYGQPLWRGSYLAVFGLSYTLNVAFVSRAARRLRQGNLDLYPGWL